MLTLGEKLPESDAVPHPLPDADGTPLADGAPLSECVALAQPETDVLATLLTENALLGLPLLERSPELDVLTLALALALAQCDTDVEPLPRADAEPHADAL